MDTQNYLVIIEPSDTGFGAYVPDVPGCIATGSTREEVERLIQEALEFHFEGMLESGQHVPPPVSQAVAVAIAVRVPAASTG